MIFRYRARDRAGALRQGQVEAAGEAQAMAELQRQGLYVVSLRRGSSRPSLTAEIPLSRSRKVSSRDLAAFCGEFSALVGAGIPILRALTLLARRFKKGPLVRILQDVVQSIEAGSSLSQALREHQRLLPPVLVYVTSVAEVSGSLESSYALLSAHFEQEENFTRKVKSAFAYPQVVLVVALGVILFMITVVLPTYDQLFGQMGAAMPASTRALIAFGQFIIRYWYLLPWPVLLAVAGLRSLMRRPAMKAAWQRAALRVPLFGPLGYKREMARLCRTLGTMTRSGVPLLSALATAREAMDHEPMRQALSAVQSAVREGETFGQSLARQPLFDPVSVDVIALGEESGNFDAMLLRVAEGMDRDVNTLLDRLTRLLEPALTVVLGGIVAAVIIPMILPMFDIISKVR